MSHSSAHGSPTTLRTTWIIALAGLALLAGGLAIADDASAANVEAVQTYIWGNTTDAQNADNPSETVDRLNHTWVPVPHEDISDNNLDVTSNITVIPEDGLLLVGVDYEIIETPAEDIRFRLVDTSTLSQADRTQHVYKYVIGGSPSEEDRNVWLANGSIPIQTSQGDNTFGYDVGITTSDGTTGTDGCGGSQTSPPVGDAGRRTCWFLIELQNPNPDLSDGAPSAGTGTDYVMEAVVNDGDGDSVLREEKSTDDGDEPRDLTMAGSSLTLQQARFTSRTVDTDKGTTVEAGRTVTLNMTVTTSGSVEERSTDWGDVDAWLCAFEDEEADNPDDPYTGFSGLHTSPADLPASGEWDSPPACEFMNFPTHNGSGAENAINFTDVEIEDNTGEGDDTRYFRATFTIDPTELELTTSEFNDQFFFRVILRDPIGNIDVHDRTGSDPGEFTVARFDVSQDLQEVSASADTLSSQTFRDNDGCFQEGTQDDAPIGEGGHDNAADNPCFIGINYAPPDQTYTFPLRVVNYANVQDEVLVEWDDPSNPGQDNWDVTIEHDDSDDQSHVVTVPAADPQPTDGGTQVNRENVNPGSTQVLVKVTPVAKALAGPIEPTPPSSEDLTQGFRTVDVQATSELGNVPDEIHRFVQAQLVQNAQGAIELGPNGDPEVTLETKTEEFNETTLTVRNTGNTNGPFDVELADAASDRCHDINVDTPNDESDIEIDLFESGTTEVPDGGIVLSPGQTRDLTVRVQPGTSVPVGSYDCEFTFEPDPDGEGDSVSQITTDPTVVVDVVGEPDIQIWDVRGADDEQVEVTGDELTVTVPPGDRVHDLYIYLENVGDVALEPQLVSVTDEDETFLVSDRFGLSGTWRGENQNGDGISQSTMASAFDLPVSDADETENVRIRELFDLDNRDIASDASDESTGDRWFCAGKDSAADTEDDQPRVVCQLHLRYEFPSNPAVKGDRVVHKFKWADTGGVGDPAQLTVRQKFRHPGTVEATSVTEKVLSDGDDTTIQFDADLTDAHRFDPDANDIDGDVRFEFDRDPCTFDSGSDDIVSTSESLRSATFRIDVSVTDTDLGTGDCDVSVANDGTFQIQTGGDGTLNASLDVGDENGTQLRQVHPASITVHPDASGSVAEPSSFTLEPSDELDADGAQFARVLFDAGANGDGFPDEDGEGMLLTRKSSGNALEPFPSCSLEGDAVVTDNAPLTWSVLRPDAEPASLTFQDDDDNQDTIDAGTDIGGLLVDTDQTGSEDEPVVIGNATLWGWDDDGISNGLHWTEGWNPLVMRLVDEDGDPALVGDESNAVDVELDLRFQARNDADGNDTITDTYELSTDDGTIQTQSLGNGMLRLDVYLPASISDDDLSNLDDDPSDLELADYNGTDNVNEQSVRYEAFALHARVSSGQSTSGQELAGDVYWQLGDLGIVADTDPDSEVGTVGDSRVAPGIHDAAERKQLTEGRVSDDDQIEYLHAAPRFLEPLMQTRNPGNDADWVSGSGAQDYTVFLMEEDSQPQDSPSGFAEQNVADGFREHTFSPHTNAEVGLIVDGNARLGIPGGESYALEPVDRDGASTDGLYSTFFVLPDTGQESFTWFTQLTVDEDQQDGREFFDVIRKIRADEDLEPSANGLPMPLCLRTPTHAFDEGDDPAGDFDLDDRDIRTIVDLRTVPGLLVDRGDFAMAPLIENGDERVHFSVHQDATFSVIGQSLLSLDGSQLPTTGETDVPVTLAVSPTPTSAVSEVNARLSQDGNEIDTATLADDDGDGVYRGSVVSAENGTHTLRVTATDTAGAAAVAEAEVSIEQNQPPSITITRPSATDGERALPSDGTIEATITDRSIFPEAITLEERIGSSGDDGGTVLSDGEVSFDSLTDEPVEGQHSVTLTFANVETGTAHVNVTDMEGVNFSAAIQDNSTSGTIQFNTTGPATVTVETNGTDGVSTQFSVTVGSAGGDGLTEVDLGSDAISCEDTSCTLTHAPSGLSDGDTYAFRIVANVSEDDKNSKGPVDVTVDDQAPSVSISIGSPKASGSPTRVGTRTSLTVEAEDNVLVQSVVLGARKGGVETGTQSFQGGDTSVSDDVSSLSQLGLDSSGTATLNATVTDIAGNTEVTQVDVRIDGEGPSLDSGTVEASGSGLSTSVTASDPAGLDVVQLRVKKPGETGFTGVTMQRGSGGEYTASVSSPGNSGTLEYYFRATDNLGNEQTLGSESSPRTFDLGSVQLENAAPEVTILSPGADAEVSGTFDLELEVSDEDAGDTVEIESVTLTPSSGSDVPIDVPGDGTTTIPVNTTDLAEGRTILEVEVTDGTDTASAQRTVFVDNLLNPCEDSPTVDGGEVTFCLAFTPDGNASDVTMELIRNGETVASAPADCDGSVCRATFPAGDVPSNSPLRPDLVVSSDDGTSQRHEGEIQSIGSALAPDEPLGRFVTTLVLAALTMGAAAYAGFRRWG